MVTKSSAPWAKTFVRLLFALQAQEKVTKLPTPTQIIALEQEQNLLV